MQCKICYEQISELSLLLLKHLSLLEKKLEAQRTVYIHISEWYIYTDKNQTEQHFNHMVIKSANTKLINFLLQGKIAYYEFNT